MSKKKKIILILIFCFLFFIAVVTVLFLNRKDKDIFSNDISKDIEYQVGNYLNGGLYVNGFVYLLTDKEHLKYYDEESEEWIFGEYDIIYRIDSNGNVEQFYSFENNDKPNAYLALNDVLYYYDGWFYVKIYYVGDEYTTQVLRISEDGATSEVVYEANESIAMGVRDNVLVISDGSRIYATNLDKGLDLEDFEDMVDVGSGLFLDDDMYNWFFFKCIYNCKTWYMDVGNREIYDDIYRQYYNEEEYIFMYTFMYDELYEHRNLVRQVYDADEYHEEEIIDYDVLSFNIYAGKIYYIRYVDEQNQLWSCNIDGTAKELVYEFDLKDNLHGKRIVVSDDNIICDFGYESGFDATERYIIGRKQDYVIQYTFDEETKVVN